MQRNRLSHRITTGMKRRYGVSEVVCHYVATLIERLRVGLVTGQTQRSCGETRIPTVHREPLN
jgi:hypothetical protein